MLTKGGVYDFVYRMLADLSLRHGLDLVRRRGRNMAYASWYCYLGETCEEIANGASPLSRRAWFIKFDRLPIFTIKSKAFFRFWMDLRIWL
jgi:hypothetical protein